LQGILGDDDVDLFEEDLTTTCPEERRFSSLGFMIAAATIIVGMVFLAYIPGARKRDRLVDRYRQVMKESADLRAEQAHLKACLRKIDEKDPYYIERLARDKLLFASPGERRLRNR